MNNYDLADDLELDGAVAKPELVRTAAFFVWGKELYYGFARTEMFNVAGRGLCVSGGEKG